MEKQELIKQSLKEVKEQEESTFKCIVQGKIRGIIDNQKRIAILQQANRRLQDELKALEFEPIADNILD